MSEDHPDIPVVRGELLPPIPRSVTLAPEVSHLPPGLLGMSLFARARYASEQKQFEAYTRLVRAKNDMLRALTEQRQLIVGYALEGERALHLDDLREIARQQIRNQLNGVHQQAVINGLRYSNEVERLLLEGEQLRKMRADFNAPAAAPANTAHPPKKTLADNFNQVGKDIEEIEAAYEKLRADLIERGGGEDRLTEDQRRQLKQFELLRDKLLNDAMEALI